MSLHRLSLPSTQQSFLDPDLCLAASERAHTDGDVSRPSKRQKTETTDSAWAPVLELVVDCHLAHTIPANAKTACTSPIAVNVEFNEPVFAVSDPVSDRPLFSFVCHETATDHLLKLGSLQSLVAKHPSISLCIRCISFVIFQMQDTLFEKAWVTARWEIRFDETLERVLRLSLNDRLRLVEYIFPKPSKEITADDFYTHIGTIPKDFIHDPNEHRRLQHPDIACQLYPFQKRAVFWMLQREGVIQAHPSCTIDMQAQLAPICEAVKDLDGNDLYMSRHQGIVSTDDSWVKTNFPIQSIRGGILAEVLALFGNFLTAFRRWALAKPSRLLILYC
jgi:hypothetical protein